MTAWHALHTVGRVQPGEIVLVNVAGSGVSTAIVQFAVAAGATVIGTAGGADKVAQALAIGCAHAVDHYAIEHGGSDVAEACSLRSPPGAVSISWSTMSARPGLMPPSDPSPSKGGWCSAGRRRATRWASICRPSITRAGR